MSSSSIRLWLASSAQPPPERVLAAGASLHPPSANDVDEVYARLQLQYQQGEKALQHFREEERRAEEKERVRHLKEWIDRLETIRGSAEGRALSAEESFPFPSPGRSPTLFPSAPIPPSLPTPTRIAFPPPPPIPPLPSLLMTASPTLPPRTSSPLSPALAPSSLRPRPDSPPPTLLTEILSPPALRPAPPPREKKVPEKAPLLQQIEQGTSLKPTETRERKGPLPELPSEPSQSPLSGLLAGITVPEQYVGPSTEEGEPAKREGEEETWETSEAELSCLSLNALLRGRSAYRFGLRSLRSHRALIVVSSNNLEC